MKAVIFDFDGTIADNFAFVHDIIVKLAPKYGFDSRVADEVVTLRDMSMADIVKRYHISRWNVFRMLLDSRKEMRKHLAECTSPKGLRELFIELQEKGVKIAIISSNSETAIQEFLVHNQISGPIDISTSYHLFGKSGPIKSYLKNHRIERLDAIYVGDEVRDIDAASEAGVEIVSVAWGYNTKEALLEKNKLTVNNVSELKDELLKRFI